MLKHFFGWLFGYCPYGGTCAPEQPFVKRSHGGKGGSATAIGKGSIAIGGASGDGEPGEVVFGGHAHGGGDINYGGGC